jgi:hypothetical protein
LGKPKYEEKKGNRMTSFYTEMLVHTHFKESLQSSKKQEFIYLYTNLIRSKFCYLTFGQFFGLASARLAILADDADQGEASLMRQPLLMAKHTKSLKNQCWLSTGILEIN